MAPFRFRAAAALELRHKQEQAAAAVLSRAEAVHRETEMRLADALSDRRRAQDVALIAERQGTDGRAVVWHRNWILHLSTAVELRRGELEASVRAVRDAGMLWREAHRKRLTLERMRERALQRHRQAAEREERKAIDELARLRFIAIGETQKGWREDA